MVLNSTKYRILANQGFTQNTIQVTGNKRSIYNGETRQFNVKKNGIYIKEIDTNVIPMTMEHLSKADIINEYILTTLRTKWGMDLRFIHEQYGSNILFEKAQYIEQLLDIGYATVNNNCLILTNASKLLAD